jgi:HEPN domain-containing protein
MDYEDRFFTRLKFSREQTEENLANARRDLEIAKKDDILDVKFNFAYSALIKGGIALLSHSQLRVKSIPGHQAKIIEYMARILNDDSIETLGNLMRQKRNQDFYSGGIKVTEKECEEYLDFVEGILKRLGEMILIKTK